ncbi:MAG TPA: HEAT repeat domain-containing protein, partial [Planctomycetaceae bacterium]|nr:HEAT repeat domain-containing protein [Planctomycetaceae bacterium]
MIVCAALVVGCQSVAPTAMTLPAETAPPVKIVTKVDPELVDQFAAWLDQEAWQVDLRWSALTLEHGSTIKSRFVFNPSPKTDTKSTVKEDDPERAAITRWNAVWHSDAPALEAADHLAVLEVLGELRSRGSKVGANATILQARLLREPTDLADKIATLARLAAGQYDGAAVKAPTTTRAAAAEAWCHLLRKSSDDALTALAPAGELLQRPGLPDELRMTLWRSLAVSIAPDHLPQLSITLARNWDGTPTGETLKRAALEACIIYGTTHGGDAATWDASLWPPQIEALRHDRDPNIRQLFGRWASLAQHPQAAAWLAGQLRDTQPMVRESALQSLGRLPTDTARTELLKSADRETGRPRALAVQALAGHSVQDVLRFARDPSADVRAAVARSLLNHPSEETAIALRPCLCDTNTDVASAALMTTQAWPIEWRLPLLLDAIRAGSLSTRQSAIFALREAIPDVPDLPIDGAADERDAAVRQLAQRHQIRLDLWVQPSEQPRTNITAAGETTAHQTALRETLRAYIDAPPQSASATEAWDRLLLTVTAADVSILEQILEETSGKPTAETVRRELLPRISPAYAALIDLESSDVQHRRRGARALLASTSQSPLTAGLLQRLRDLLTYEQDQQVWQSCLAALQPDAHADAAPIVLLAIHQTWPDIRRLGLDVITRHPAPEAATWLLPLLADPQRTVKLAAVRTLAACGNPVAIDGLPAANGAPAVPGLRSLMTDNDEELRQAAIVSAATLHDELALQELTRLGQDPRPTTRDFAAQAMARTGQARYIDTLIRMAWTETADPVKLS